MVQCPLPESKLVSQANCHDCNAPANVYSIPGDVVVVHQGVACGGFRERFKQDPSGPLTSRGLDERGLDTRPDGKVPEMTLASMTGLKLTRPEGPGDAPVLLGMDPGYEVNKAAEEVASEKHPVVPHDDTIRLDWLSTAENLARTSWALVENPGKSLREAIDELRK